jgi:cell division protein FtsB
MMTSASASTNASKHRSWGGPARVAVAALAVVAILFLFVFPFRSYLAQRNEVNDARHDVGVMQEQNAKLEHEAELLKTQEEIERVAREQFRYVYPGERAFAVIPAPETTTTTPP